VTAASRRARTGALDEFRTTLALLSRIAMFLSKILQGAGPGVTPPLKVTHKPYQMDSGRFCGGSPKKESYNSAMTPTTMATSARLKTYQL
jgi:hypothetical protein